MAPATRNRVYEAIAPLENLPLYGSPIVSATARRRFGEGLRKLVVAPYDILYHYDENRDVVEVDGAIHMRTQR